MITKPDHPYDSLLDAANRLNAEAGQGGLESSRRREAALADGLDAIAAMAGRTWRGSRYINSNGEFELAIEHPEGRPQECGTFGVALAMDIGRIPTRCGIASITSTPLPENGWTRINHFDAARLIFLVESDLAIGRRGGMEAVANAIARLDGYARNGWERSANDADGVTAMGAFMRRNAASELAVVYIPVSVSLRLICVGDTHLPATADADAVATALLAKLGALLPDVGEQGALRPMAQAAPGVR